MKWFFVLVILGPNATLTEFVPGDTFSKIHETRAACLEARDANIEYDLRYRDSMRRYAVSACMKKANGANPAPAEEGPQK